MLTTKGWKKMNAWCYWNDNIEESFMKIKKKEGPIRKKEDTRKFYRRYKNKKMEEIFIKD